jgi:hypothetical protein
MNINQDYKESVIAIKETILRSQRRAIAAVNKEQLSLYYGIGRYVSLNSRDGFWGTGAIEQISNMLQKELPGLRGFSVANIKKMRNFYEEWHTVINRSFEMSETQDIEYSNITNRSLSMSDFENKDYQFLLQNRQLITDDLQNYEYKDIPNSQPLADEIQTVDLNRSPMANKLRVNDYTKPMGVATYRTAEEMPENWRNVLPDIDKLKKLL